MRSHAAAGPARGGRGRALVVAAIATGVLSALMGSAPLVVEPPGRADPVDCGPAWLRHSGLPPECYGTSDPWGVAARWGLLLAAVLVLAAAAQSLRTRRRRRRQDGGMTAPDVPVLLPREVDGQDLLLDVREPQEWACGHAPQAVHVPLHDVPAAAARLPRDRRVAVVCRVGGRSWSAAAYLRSVGVDAHNVDGGMVAWAAGGLPLVGDADPPRVL